MCTNLGVLISYNKKIQDDLNFTKTIKNLQCYKAMAHEKTNFGR